MMTAANGAALVLGLDVGGTWTRALVASVDGARLGAGRVAGGNPVAHGVEAGNRYIGAAIEEALARAGVSAAEVGACVVGMAGASKLAADPSTAEAFAELWRRLGLVNAQVEIVSDVATAYTAGSAEPDGVVLLAGTGAVAATIRNRRPVSVYGGHGWLLGDEGSGYWIGREAVRATLSALDDGEFDPAGGRVGGLLGGLLGEVLAAYDVQVSGVGRPGAGLIAAVNARPAVDLARLVPCVVAAYEEGDPVARRIVADAADALLRLLTRARAAAEGQGPIVLAGGVLTPGSCVYEAVSAASAEAWPEASMKAGVDGVGAATWLAALRLLGDGVQARELHGQLLG